jgi:TPR repeat protein
MVNVRCFLRCLVLAFALVGATPSVADERLDLFLRGFDEMSLWHDNKTPVGVRKWRVPLRVRMTGPMSSSYDDLVMARLNQIAGIAGLTVERLSPNATDETFLVAFDESSGYMIGGRMASCYAQTRLGNSGEIVHARLVINLRVGFGLRRCITHELMHAVGFPGHPHGINTVLSYVHQAEELTEIDVMSLRVLYDQRITIGMYHLPALLTARRILAGRLGLDNPDTLGRKYLDAAVGYLAQEAEKGNALVQAQLGNAYFYSQYVERDDAKAIAWWRRAAEAGHVDAQFRLGYAAETGRVTASGQREAVEWYRMAAARGHALALNNLGLHYRDGRGVERDPVAAFMYLRVAEQRGFKGAAEHRDKIARFMTAEQIAEGDRRAADWKPQQ